VYEHSSDWNICYISTLSVLNGEQTQNDGACQNLQEKLHRDTQPVGLYIFFRLKLAVNLSMYNEITLLDQLHAALADFQ
jgi:hypothetical protein